MKIINSNNFQINSNPKANHSQINGSTVLRDTSIFKRGYRTTARLWSLQESLIVDAAAASLTNHTPTKLLTALHSANHAKNLTGPVTGLQQPRQRSF